MFRVRSLQSEILDDPSTKLSELHASLRFMAFVNRWFGGRQAIYDFFEKENIPKVFSVLDLGTGGGDIPRALVEWARRRKKVVRVTALDLNSHCLAYAQKHSRASEIRFVHHSAFNLNTLDKHDYVISSMFFHHLSDADITRLLRLIQSHAKKGFIINDLSRTAAGYAAAALAGAMTGKYIVYHDAKLSVARAFRKEDWHRLANEAELKNFRIRKKLFFRLTLEGRTL